MRALLLPFSGASLHVSGSRSDRSVLGIQALRSSQWPCGSGRAAGDLQLIGSQEHDGEGALVDFLAAINIRLVVGTVDFFRGHWPGISQAAG